MDMNNKLLYICHDCWKKIYYKGLEIEVFTSPNLLNEKCPICYDKTGSDCISLYSIFHALRLLINS
jgi:hypothetical protein